MPDFDFSTPDQIIARREEAKQSEHDARLALPFDLRCPLTWIGVRTYRDAATGLSVSMCDADQTCSGRRSSRVSLTLMTLPVKSGVLQVGQTGDLIERVEIDGAPLPVAGVAIHGAAAIADIEGGKTQTSLGYGCLVDHTPPRLMAKWDADTRPLMCDAPYVDRDLRADVRNALARAGWRIEYVDPPASIDSAEWLMQPHATSTIWAPTEG